MIYFYVLFLMILEILIICILIIFTSSSPLTSSRPTLHSYLLLPLLLHFMSFLCLLVVLSLEDTVLQRTSWSSCFQSPLSLSAIPLNFRYRSYIVDVSIGNRYSMNSFYLPFDLLWLSVMASI